MHAIDPWFREFPPLAALAPPERMVLSSEATLLHLPAGTTVFAPHQPCAFFILIRSGSVRVYQLDTAGNEIVLYRLQAGAICILTTLTLLAQQSYSAYAVTESPVEAIGIPASAFDKLIAQSAGFRSFVFGAQAARLTDLMQVIQHVAFESIDSRLAARLLTLAGGGSELSMTHQQLAAEIGTAREVVSRHLKAFERRGWIRLGRGRVELRDTGLLRAAAADTARAPR